MQKGFFHFSSNWFRSRSFSDSNLKAFRGFTLIELLIVIAIILILIAIALPNFLEAQMRARVTKAKGELRSLGIAQEAYYLDWGFYPSESEDNPYARPRTEQGLYWLTFPIAYLTSIPVDPFGTQDTGGNLTIYESGGIELGGTPMLGNCSSCLATWAIYTLGPDTPGTDIVSDHPHYGTYGTGTVSQYSPTNGTKSTGDIFLFGGDPFWIGVSMGVANRGIYRSAPPGSLDVGLPVNGVPHLHKLPPGL